MAIENTYLLGKNITLGCGFDLQAKAPLDSRETVATYAGLAALVNGNAAYEGMRVFVETGDEKGNYQYINGEWKNELAELKALIDSTATAAMEFKGTASELPATASAGDFYKVVAEFKVADVTAKLGDSIVYDGETWYHIPSGDDIEDTWRPITGVKSDAELTFEAGDGLEKTVAETGTVTYKHIALDAPKDVTAEGEERTRTYITALISDGMGHIIGYKTATENVEDTNTTYAFEGISDDAGSNVSFTVTPSEIGGTEGSPVTVRLDAYTRGETDNLVAKKIGDFKTAIVDPIAADVADFKANKAEYATTAQVATAKQEAIDAAKDYADSLDHEDTTYTVAPTDNALEFTVTPTGKGEAQTVKLVAPDVGVTKIVAGNADIVVTPEVGTGVVTVAHKTYETGTVKDVAHDDDTDPSFITGITIDNGHVTGATVKNLKTVLQSMVVVLDGGTLKFTTDNI